MFEFGRSRAAREEGNFSYKNATVAEVDGEVVACLVDYPLDDPYDTGDLNDLPEVVRPLVELESKAPGSWYINVVAAFPEFRGQGIGARLLALAEDHGRARKARIGQPHRGRRECRRRAALCPHRLCRGRPRPAGGVSRMPPRWRLGADDEADLIRLV